MLFPRRLGVFVGIKPTTPLLTTSLLPLTTYSFYYLLLTTIADNGYYAPLVELTFKYRQPIVYGMKCRIDIFYVPTEAAKIVFDYEIRRSEDNALMATGHSVQAFMNKQYQLEWYRPPFYQEWQERWKVV